MDTPSRIEGKPWGGSLRQGFERGLGEEGVFLFSYGHSYSVSGVRVLDSLLIRRYSRWVWVFDSGRVDS